MKKIKKMVWIPVVVIILFLSFTCGILYNSNYRTMKNIQNIVRDVYKEDNNLAFKLFDDNNILVITSLDGTKVAEVFEEFKNIKLRDIKIVFSSNENFNEDEFYDGNLSGVIKKEDGKLSVWYYKDKEVDSRNEVINEFDITSISKEENLVKITIKITGNSIDTLIGEAKLITNNIIEVNQIDETFEVITYIDTDSHDYEISNKNENIIKELY